ncbi:MAG: hypothetical protein C4582_05425, partial [Desulfobacteraceae bacterium]
MDKRVFKVILSLVLTLFFTSTFNFTTGVSYGKEKPIIVGAPIPRASAYGQNGERGMIMAVEEINAAGGVKVAGKMRPIKLEIIDSRDEEPGVPTSEVLLAIEKLIL